jgi:hypothetical protein
MVHTANDVDAWGVDPVLRSIPENMIGDQPNTAELHAITKLLLELPEVWLDATQPKITVGVRGGVVTDILANQPHLKVLLIDEDNLQEEGEDPEPIWKEALQNTPHNVF